MELTEAKIRTLQPKAARYLVSDGNGLSLDVLTSGKKSWVFRYWVNGKQEKVTLGRYPDMSLKAARAAQVGHAQRRLCLAARRVHLRALLRQRRPPGQDEFHMPVSPARPAQCLARALVVPREKPLQHARPGKTVFARRCPGSSIA